MTPSGSAWAAAFSFGAAFASDQTTPFVVGTISVQGLQVGGELILDQQSYTFGDFSETSISDDVVAATVEQGGGAETATATLQPTASPTATPSAEPTFTEHAAPLVSFNPTHIGLSGQTDIEVSIDPNGTALAAFTLVFAADPSAVSLVSLSPGVEVTPSGSAGAAAFSFGAAFASDQTTPFVVGTISVQGLQAGGALILDQQSYTFGDFSETTISDDVVAATVEHGGATATSVPTDTVTATPTLTNTPGATPVSTAIRTKTPAQVPTASATSQPNASPTSPPSATVTAVAPPTATEAAPTSTATASPTGTASVGSPSCVGDCNGDEEVTVDELISGVNIALGSASVDTCLPMDANGDREVTVDELIAAVNNGLLGCEPQIKQS